MGNLITILNRGSFLFLMTTFLLSAKVTASDDLNQYGLGTEGLNLSLEKRSQKKNTAALRSPETLSNYQFIKDFETDYLKYTVELETDKTRAQQKSQGIDKPILQLDVEYQDTAVDFNSPYHAVNSDLNNQLNNTSNEYQTRMEYRFKYLTPEASFNYSPDSYGFGEYYNYGLGLAVPVKDVFSLETRYAWNKFDKNTEQGGINDYQDWSIGVSTMYKGMKLKVDYMDMNSSENSQECGKLFPCEGKTVFSIIKNF